MANETRNRVIKPMETCQRSLTYVNVCPADENTSKWKKVFYKIFALIIFTFISLGLFGSVAHFLKFISSDPEKSLSAVYQIFAMLCFINSMIVTFFARRKLLAMFKSLGKINANSKKINSTFK